MADLATYKWGLANSGLTVTGTVVTTGPWVLLTGTLTVDNSLYAYGRVTETGEIIGSGSQPGFAVFQYDPPLFFARLPNPPFGAKIYYAADPTEPSAMTPLDPVNYYGVARDADTFPYSGKYLFSQVRSNYLHDSGTISPELGPWAIRREYKYFNVAGYSLDIATRQWVPIDAHQITLPAGNAELDVISRGSETLIALHNSPSPGEIYDFNVRWYNGVGFRCGDAPGTVAFGAAKDGAVPLPMLDTKPKTVGGGRLTLPMAGKAGDLEAPFANLWPAGESWLRLDYQADWAGD